MDKNDCYSFKEARKNLLNLRREREVLLNDFEDIRKEFYIEDKKHFKKIKKESLKGLKKTRDFDELTKSFYQIIGMLREIKEKRDDILDMIYKSPMKNGI